MRRKTPQRFTGFVLKPTFSGDDRAKNSPPKTAQVSLAVSIIGFSAMEI